MSKSMKIANPTWVVVTILASSLSLVFLGFLGVRMFASEIALHREQSRRKLVVEKLVSDQRVRLADATDALPATDQDADKLRRLENVLAQMKHPYLHAQLSLLREDETVDASAVPVEPIDLELRAANPKVVWLSSPEGLAKFIQANRPLLNTLYDLVSESVDDPQLSSYLASNGIQHIFDLALFDVADALLAKDRDRMLKVLNVYFLLHEKIRYSNAANYYEFISLLHRGIDDGILDLESAESWLDRIASSIERQVENNAKQPMHSEYRIAASYEAFRPQVDGLGIPPSIKESMFEYYLFRNNFNSGVLVATEGDYVGAITYFTLAVRVALLKAVEDQQGHPDVPGDVLARLRMPIEVERVLMTRLKDASITTLFEYEAKSSETGELRFSFSRDISSGAFPSRLVYEISTRK